MNTSRPDRPRMSWLMPRVLMYHNFGPPPPGGDPEHLFVGVDTFRSHLALLRKRGWRALSLTEFLATLDGTPAPRKSFLVTIDDGHESVLRDAAPILAEAGMPSVLFVPPTLLGEPDHLEPGLCERAAVGQDRDRHPGRQRDGGQGTRLGPAPGCSAYARRGAGSARGAGARRGGAP